MQDIDNPSRLETLHLQPRSLNLIPPFVKSYNTSTLLNLPISTETTALPGLLMHL